MSDEIMYEELDTLKVNTGAGWGSIISVGNGGIGAGSITTTTSNNTISGVRFPSTTNEEILDKYSFNEVLVEHKISAAELLAIKDTVDFKDIIKQNLTKYAAKEIANKMNFTKKHDMDSDSHLFRGRCWVFTREELLELIEGVKHGIR